MMEKTAQEKRGHEHRCAVCGYTGASYKSKYGEVHKRCLNLRNEYVSYLKSKCGKKFKGMQVGDLADKVLFDEKAIKRAEKKDAEGKL